MGIQVEFNPDLALRNYSEFRKGARKKEECVPLKLEVGKIYDFLKKGQRNYWLFGELPLLETKGNQELSLPLASIVIKEAKHILIEGEIYTVGKYEVREIFRDKSAHFNGFAKV
ncbi:MAG: hypothetical protein WCT25_02720 [Candidatus Paceibacterota bacterium]|jgi:hypothetical protein